MGSLATEWADDLWRFLRQTAVATEGRRLELAEEAVARWNEALAHAGLVGTGPLAVIPGDAGALAALGRVLPRVRGLFWRAAYLTVCHHHQALRAAPCAPEGDIRASGRPSTLWRGLAKETRVTLTHWLVQEPAYRAALCLRYELGQRPSLVRRVLQLPSRQALDTLFTRARRRFASFYDRLERLNSPPFPGLVFEALTDTGAPAPRAGAGPLGLASELVWLRKALRRRGGY
jgi:hypothetical protein